MVIEPLKHPNWKGFVESHPDMVIFHHPTWLRLLADQYGFTPLAACVVDADRIAAALPMCIVKGLRGRQRLVSLPFSDYCSPLVSSTGQVETILREVAVFASRESMPVEIRGPAPEALGFCQGDCYWLHTADISAGEEQLFKLMKPRVQRAVRKARTAGIATEIRTDEAAVEIFYGLHLKTRRRQGVPIQPRRYFARLFEHVICGGLGFVSVTRKDDQVLSAGVFCGFGKTLTYKYGASDPEQSHLAPNYPMFWETIRYAKAAGFSILDFGKTDQGNEGLTHFKDGWNSRKVPLSYSHRPKLGGSRLMKSVKQRLVEPIIKASPEFVCRVTGEVLYKYFG